MSQLREPKPMIGVIVSDQRGRVVGSPFHVQGQTKAAAREAVSAAEAKRDRRAEKRKGDTDGET